MCEAITSSTTSSRPRQKRRGAAVLEVLVSLAVLSMMFGLMARMSVAVSRQRTKLEVQRVALQRESNLMAVAMALPYGEVDQERLLLEARTFVDDASWDVDVEESAVQLVGTQAVAKEVRIRRLPSGSVSGLTARRPLIAWRHAAESEGN